VSCFALQCNAAPVHKLPTVVCTWQ